MIEPLAEIESCYLSACLLDEGCLDLYRCSGLPLDLMQGEFTQLALAKMLELSDKGASVDIASLAKEFSASGHSRELLAVAGLFGRVETTAHAKSHFAILRDGWHMREYRQKLQKLQGFAGEEKWEDVREKVQAAAAAIVDVGRGEERRSQREVALSAVTECDRLIEGRPLVGSKPIETGIGCIDRFCRPLDVATGDFNCILFAATSTGKSSLMAGIVGHNVAKGLRVAVFLGETSHENLVWQMAGQRARVSVDHRDFQTEPRNRQAALRAELDSLVAAHDRNLWVYDDEFYWETVAARCRRLNREVGGLDLVVIDHLHCLRTKEKFRDERLRFNYMSGEIKPLAKSLNCPILVLAQPSRDFKTAARPPLLSDLKESGNLEDDADRVWALYLPPEDSQGIEQSRYSDCPEIELHQIKFRRGSPCTLRLRFERRYTRFYEEKGGGA